MPGFASRLFFTLVSIFSFLLFLDHMVISHCHDLFHMLLLAFVCITSSLIAKRLIDGGVDL